MKFNNKYFRLDNEDTNYYIIFYNNNIYKNNIKLLDKKTRRIIGIGFSYFIYFADAYYISPYLKEYFKNNNYNIFMNIIRCLSLLAFFLPFFIMKKRNNNINVKKNIENNFEKIDESSLNYSHIKKTLYQNIWMYICLFLFLLMDIWFLFFYPEKEYFLHMFMVMILSIVGFIFGAENFIAAFVWKFKYLKRHKNDEK